MMPGMLWTRRPQPIRFGSAAAVAVALATLAALEGVDAQDRLRALPAFERYQRMAREIPASVELGRIAPVWIDRDTFEFNRQKERVRYDIATRRSSPAGVAEPVRPDRSGAIPRRATPLLSPVGRLRAFVEDGNVWVGGPETARASRASTGGSETGRLRYGLPPDLYRTELNQRTGLWWSPGGTRLAFYRVDAADSSARPTPAAGGTTVDVLVYDVAARRTRPLLAGTAADAPGYYVYRVSWLDERELLVLRMNRRQTVLELTACDAERGGCRPVARETATEGWVDTQPELVILADQRLIWSSERSGFRNLYLYDRSGRMLETLTRHRQDVREVVRVVESPPQVFYTAGDGDNPLKLQLHRVRLDGRDEQRLTDPDLHHTVSVSPDGRFVVDVAEAHNRAPVTRVLDRDGGVIANVVSSDTTGFAALGLRRVELFSFRAADGTTRLHGVLHFPSSFDPGRRYPLLVTAYPGPATTGVSEAFTLPDRLTELGFLVASFEARGSPGRGVRFRSALHTRFGLVDVDDQAAGVRSLVARDYVDRTRVGIFGTSYGGYVAVMAVLRHPDVFRAAGASSAVSRWQDYNALYTERYMGLMQREAAAYALASPLPLASALTRPLLLYYGTADDNVSPTHTQRLANAFRAAGKAVTVVVGTNRGHTSVDETALMAFFVDALDIRDPDAPAQ